MERINKQGKWLLEKYVSYFFIYSFIGWVIEVIITLFETKELVNRGFLTLPILPIYGFGSVIISIIFKDDDYHWFNVALVGGLIATTVELGTSLFLEKTLNIELWNYTGMKYNFQGRISLLTTSFFMVASILIIKIINPVVERKLRRVKYNMKYEIILGILCVVTFIDFIRSLQGYII